jgi:uncharacterized protein (DUF2147 family)
VAGATPGIPCAQEQLSEDELLGEWVLPESGSMIRAHRCGDIFCDANAKVDPPKRWDSAPKPRIPALLIPADLRRQSATAWRAEFLNIRDGETYEGTITLVDKNRLSFVRCLIGSVFCETVIFHRIVSPNASEPPKQARGAPPDRQDAATTPLRTVNTESKPLAKQASRADFEAFLKQRSTSSATAGSAPAAEQPTRADFEAFLREHNAGSSPAPEQQALFKEFMAWRNKR